MALKYKDRKENEARLKADMISKEMPSFVRQFFMAEENHLSGMTLYSYASQLKTFFEFLRESNPYFGAKDMRMISTDDMGMLTDADIAEFLHDLRMPKKRKSNAGESVCSETTIMHYMVSLNRLFNYLAAHRYIKSNPVELIKRGRVKKKEIIYLERDEKNDLLHTVESGERLTKNQQKFHDLKASKRDTAICTIFLDTGIRVSELVGMNINDINFSKHGIRVFRKGGNFDTVYMSDKAEGILLDYLENGRPSYNPSGKEEAVFLNRSGERISVRSVQKLVKKYMLSAVPDKADRITPHKLRTTFAENMLLKTGDVEKVQKLMGHSSISSTMHYVTSTEEAIEAVRNLSQD
ncbi:MAG: tyrosine-type recombinase/integrase [Lachnospiraceae bacterium]|nr:tyrosine-type recombinase/integrase [Lachnospiraceae bacterium]